MKKIISQSVQQMQITPMHKTFGINGLKKIVGIVLVITLFSNCNSDMEPLTADLLEFNSHFETEQIEAFAGATESFRGFLLLNYPELSCTEKQVSAYLNDLKEYGLFYKHWVFCKTENKAILEKIEISGLRKEIRVYGHEIISDFKCDSTEAEVIPIRLKGVSEADHERERLRMQNEADSTLYSNTKGKYAAAVCNANNFVQFYSEYCEAREKVNPMIPAIIVHGLLKDLKESDYANPIIQRVIIVELYWWQIKIDLEKGKKAPNKGYNP